MEPLFVPGAVATDMSFICVVCGQGGEPDTDHVTVEVTHKRMQDRDDVAEYYLYDRCA